MVGTMEHSLDKMIEQIKQFCKNYNVDIEVETQGLNLGGDRKVEVKVIRRK